MIIAQKEAMEKARGWAIEEGGGMILIAKYPELGQLIETRTVRGDESQEHAV